MISYLTPAPRGGVVNPCQPAFVSATWSRALAGCQACGLRQQGLPLHIAQALAPADPQALAQAYGCHLCGLCVQVCPRGCAAPPCAWSRTACPPTGGY